MIENWIGQFPLFIQLVIWMTILGILAVIWLKVIKWIFVGSLTAIALFIGMFGLIFKKMLSRTAQCGKVR